ncbi:MAG TPA: multidrug DMT transporter permease [Kiritimatiellia bacterium]|nr:multidrug DMT transporter permease [Kiritimatiellia bacterium]HRU71338.1 multidrug DMT transporter permease [Kiritimatiellia bacterium]
MFFVENYAVAVAFCVITMLCWGSWGNTQKLASNDKWKYQLFYWDYGIGILLSSLLFAFTLGSCGAEGRGFLADIRQAGPDHLGLAFLGGVLFNLANILLVIAIDLAGLAVAFPVGIGLALVLGVALVMLAIILNALAYRKLVAAKAADQAQQGGFGLGITISVIAGVLMGAGFFGLVSKGMAKSFAHPEAGLMTPYTALVVFALGLFVSNFVWNTIVSFKPVRGQPVPPSAYFSLGTPRLHAVGILGGTIWNIGMALSLIAAGKAGPAISYGLGQGATLVAALWGILVWKEFKGAPSIAHKLNLAMFVLFVIGLLTIILAGL